MQKINHIMNTMLAIYAKKEFSTDDKYYEVKDHYHYIGKYWVTAYSVCNLIFKKPKKFL